MKHSLRNYLMFLPVIALRVPAAAFIYVLLLIGDLGHWLDDYAFPMLPTLDIDFYRQQARQEEHRKAVIRSYFSLHAKGGDE